MSELNRWGPESKYLWRNPTNLIMNHPIMILFFSSFMDDFKELGGSFKEDFTGGKKKSAGEKKPDGEKK